MKVLLIMQIITSGSYGGSPAIETVLLDDLDQCQKAKSFFIHVMKEDRSTSKIYRKAECVLLKAK